ncbi:hypothetical protein BSKO_02899 [Bryopsis sp. KO-2023]|nr:hypothetical protein BSKO_02899 [Bryopsis sp. KO-2023]
MAKAIKATSGLLAVGGGVFFARAYYDVFTAERHCDSIKESVRMAKDLRVTLEKTIQTHRRTLADLEREGTIRLQEQDDVRKDIEAMAQKIQSLKSKLKDKQSGWTQVQNSIADLNNEIGNLRTRDSRAQEEIEVGAVQLEAAEAELSEAKEFANPMNSRLMKHFFDRSG